MKKICLILSVLLSMNLVQASNKTTIPFNDIKTSAKITYHEDVDKWTTAKRKDNYFIKTINADNYSEYLTKDKAQSYSTGCEFDFLNNGKLIGYSNSDLKFYDITIIDGYVNKRPLDAEEVAKIFKHYKLIKISDFSQNTNSIKFKKHGKTCKILILNDSDRVFNNYSYTSGNAKFRTYPLLGFLDITKRGMIQFSSFGENSKNTPWFIILAR